MCALYLLWRITTSSWAALLHGSAPTTGTTHAAEDASAIRSYVLNALLGVVGLGCLAGADGARAVGLRPALRWTGHVRTAGTYFQGPAVIVVIGLYVLKVLATRLPGLVGTAPAFLSSDPPAWLVIVTSSLTAISEETLLLGVCARLLDYIPLGRGRQLGRYGWWSIGILAALRVGYHLYQGFEVIPDIVPLALLLPYVYRRSGALIPLIVAHALFDVISVSLSLVWGGIVDFGLAVLVWAVVGGWVVTKPVRPGDQIRKRRRQGPPFATQRPADSRA